MKRLTWTVLLWSGCTALFAQTVEPRADAAACDPTGYPPDRFHVAIDRASGMAFIETPCGWTWIGVIARGSIDADIRMSGARPVPPDVLRAELARQPALAESLRATGAHPEPLRKARAPVASGR